MGMRAHFPGSAVGGKTQGWQPHRQGYAKGGRLSVSKNKMGALNAEKRERDSKEEASYGGRGRQTGATVSGQC